MHSFAVLDISPGLGNERLICDHAYYFKGVSVCVRVCFGGGGGGGWEDERRKDCLIPGY